MLYPTQALVLPDTLGSVPSRDEGQILQQEVFRRVLSWRPLWELFAGFWKRGFIIGFADSVISSDLFIFVYEQVGK